MGSGLHSLITVSGLPLNRKERFYTGTVLPGLMFADGMESLETLPAIVADAIARQGLPASCPDIKVDSNPLSMNLQVYTEFSLRESVMADHVRFPRPLPKRDTPDVVVYCSEPTPSLLAIESKMFMRTRAAQLRAQMKGQKAVLSYLGKALKIAPQNVLQIALIPRPMIKAGGFKPESFGYPIITWEAVLEAFGGDTYWHAILKYALDHWVDLVSPLPEGRMWGGHIRKRFFDGGLMYKTMGRAGGLGGTALADEIADGSWRHQPYLVRKQGTPLTGNWFRIEDFVAKLEKEGQ